jgi:hypothetical protein
MVNYFIHCHACYVNKSNKFSNPNIKLFFDTPINNPACSIELQIDFDKSKYEFSEHYMNPKLDYILSFKDEAYSSTKTSIKMLGIFDDNYNRVEIKNITNGSFNDILLSDLLQFLIPKNTPSKIYCTFCRNPCDDSIPHPYLVSPLEYGIEDDDNFDALYDYDIDLMDVDYRNMNDVDYQNVFYNGGKLKNKTYKTRNKHRKKQIKSTRKSKSIKRRTIKRSSYKK